MFYSGDELSFGERPPSGWEYVLVVRAPSIKDLRDDGEKTGVGKVRTSILQQLRRAGIAYSQLWVPSARIILVRLALPESALDNIAECTGFQLQLLNKYGGGYLAFKKDRKHAFVNSNHINSNGNAIDDNNNNTNSYFTASQRLQLNLEVLGSTAQWGAGIDVEEMMEKGLLLDAYPMHKQEIKQQLYRGVVMKRLWDPTFRPNFTHLRDYFGTRVTLYFAYLNFFTRMLIGISALCIPVHFLENSYTIFDTEEKYLRVAYVFVLIFWSAYFVKLWKRRNAILNVKWGSLEAEKDSFFEVRPQYAGEPRQGFYSKGGFVDLSDLDASIAKNSTHKDATDNNNNSNIINSPPAATPSNGEEESWIPDEITVNSIVETFQNDPDFQLLTRRNTGNVLKDLPSFPYFDKKEQLRRIRIGWAVTIAYGLSMIGITCLPVFYAQAIVDKFSIYSWGDSVPGISAAVLIFLSEHGWKFVFPYFVKWENHRTKQSYINSIITKRFSFDFTVNYCSLFYIAFIKPYTHENPCVINVLDGKPDCLLEMRNMLSGIVITKASIEHLPEIIVPCIQLMFSRAQLWYSVRVSGNTADSDQVRSVLLPRTLTGRRRSEDEADLVERNLPAFENCTEEYSELVIMYGFVAMFGLIWPLTPLVFYASCLIESRADAFKFLYLQSRPPAENTGDIGFWLWCMKFIQITGIFTNAVLVVFTSHRGYESFESVSNRRIAAFFVLQVTLIFVTLCIDYAYDDIPGRVHRLKARQDYLIARYFGVGEKPYYRLNISGHRSHEYDDDRESEGGNSDLAQLIDKVS